MAAACCWSSTSACCRSTTSSTSSVTLPRPARSRWWSWTACAWPSPSARTPGTTRTSGRAGSIRSIPMEELMRQHPAVHINLSSSPFWHGKRAMRRQMLAAIARRDGIPVLMCNQVGGNDSLIFDGSSLALNARGELIAQAASFRGGSGGGRSLRLRRSARRSRGGRYRGRLPRPGAGHARLRAQVRLQQGAGGTERRHRLGAGGGHRQRRAGRGERDRRRHAQPLLVSGLHRRQPAAGRQPRHPL